MNIRERIKWQNITQRGASSGWKLRHLRRERWLLRDQNIPMSVSRGMNGDGSSQGWRVTREDEREGEHPLFTDPEYI